MKSEKQKMRFIKKIAPFFLIFAGFILLAHTVIPHHHHDDSTIVLLSIHKSNCTPHDHNQCDSNHCDNSDRDCRDNSKNCTDANIVLKGGDDSREELTVEVNDLTPLLLLFSAVDEYHTLIEDFQSEFYDTFTIPDYTDYLPDSQGLRAPPVC